MEYYLYSNADHDRRLVSHSCALVPITVFHLVTHIMNKYYVFYFALVGQRIIRNRFHTLTTHSTQPNSSKKTSEIQTSLLQINLSQLYVCDFLYFDLVPKSFVLSRFGQLYIF